MSNPYSPSRTRVDQCRIASGKYFSFQDLCSPATAPKDVGVGISTLNVYVPDQSHLNAQGNKTQHFDWFWLGR